MLKEDVSKYDLSALKHCCTAGEALNPEVYNQWKRATGLRIFEGFGQTETTLSCSTLYPWVQPRPGSMGLPTPGYDLVIADENGQEVDPGVTGEICLKAASLETRTKGLFMGYYQDEISTQKAWHDGLYHTGDTATVMNWVFYGMWAEMMTLSNPRATGSDPSRWSRHWQSILQFWNRL
ncbi:hypothetical protein N752_24945 [Desulforamulus aquiferis]|nr:hypothetical protein N752_24945 [Desulforamulus aquiferis]